MTSAFLTSSRLATICRASAAVMVVVGSLGSRAEVSAGVTIIPTFDSSITSDPNAAAIEAAINESISLYSQYLLDPITVTIDYTKGSGLGSNSTYYEAVRYTTYLTDLKNDATTNNDTIALAHLPSSTRDPVVNSRNIDAKLPNLRALGISASPPTGQTDSTITLNTSLTFPGSPNSSQQYSLLSVIEHETDEVLGLGSALPDSTTTIFPEDLFRYSSNGTRSFTTSGTSKAYFSLDGTTDLAQFDNQNDGGDFGDWQSNPLPSGVAPKVQDGFATPGAAPSLGIELIALDSIGYNVANVWIGNGSSNTWSTALNWAATPSNGSNLIFSGTLGLTNTNNSLTGVGSMTFDMTAGSFVISGSGVTLAGGIVNNSPKSQTINLNLTLAAAQQFNAAFGNIVINGTLANGGNTLTVSGGFNSNFGNSISGTGGLIKSGSGTLTLSASNSYSGGTTVNAGLLVLGHAAAVGTGGLAITNSAATNLSPGLSSPVVLSSLSINGGSSAPTATFDLTNNKVVLTNTTFAAAQATYSQVVNQVKYAADSSAWDKPGITSSTVANDVNVLGIPTGIGVVLNNNLNGNGNASDELFYGDGTSLPQFAGVSVNQNSVLLKYTYLGDSNLDGKVDSTDFGLFQTGYQRSDLGLRNLDGPLAITTTTEPSTLTDFGFFQAGFYNYFTPTRLRYEATVSSCAEPATYS